MRLVDPVSGQVLYLFRGENAEGRQAILSFSDGVFAKVETDSEIPSEGPWGPISWFSSLLSDSRSGTALIAGLDEQRRVYLLAADCRSVPSGDAAAIKIYYTHPIKDFCYGPVTLLPDGRIVVTGGIAPDDPMGNYNPSAKVFAFGPFEASSTVARAGRWWWFMLALLFLLAGGWWLIRRRRSTETPQQEEATDVPAPSDKDLALYAQIGELMEGEQLYRQTDLTIADLASRLRSNTKYISNAIGAGAGCGFKEFLNNYRIRESEKLLLSMPDAHMNEISEAVGYANESSFFRNFKLVHGCSPQQWLEREGQD
jgi:Response regulator containing CheY-like receiver domain and AraC-type DNA-binding domain